MECKTNFDLTEEEQMIRDTVRKFAAENVAPIAEEVDQEAKFPLENFKQMAELGLLGIPYPEEYGGSGFNTLCYAIAVEELARVCGSTALSFAAHTSLGTGPIFYFGNEEQKKKYVPDLASGNKIGCFGLTEPGAGSDAAGIRTKAVKDGDHWILNGQKCFATNANYSSTFVVTAVTDPEKGPKGITAFVVEKDTPGFTVQKGEEKLGTRGSDWGDLFFSDCRIPDSQRLGPEGEGFTSFMKTLEGGRISIGAMALGLAQGAMDHAVKYSKEREAFGKTISRFQAIGFKIADMETEISAARHLVYHAARVRDAGKPFAHEASMAKLHASEVAMRVTYNAIQVFGGYGFIREYPVERYYRDAKLCTIGEGTSEVQRMIISRNVLTS